MAAVVQETDHHLKPEFERELGIFRDVSQDFLSMVPVFPCINSYSRLKLHEVTKEKFPELTSFSVGEEPERRPVICKQQLIADWTLKSLVEPVAVLPEKNSITKKGSKAQKPTQALYVPKALRHKKAEQQQQQPQPVSQIKTWMDELEFVTGPVRVIPPLTDFLALEAGCVTSSDVATRRVVELGDFPKELKTSDLESVLHSGLVKIKDYYDLRWVDDTHALVIFTDERTAAMALRIRDVQIKFRPFYEACDASKNKAKSFRLEAEEHRAEKARPNTSTVMARRLLSRALNNPDIKASPHDENVLHQAKKEASAARGSPSTK